MKPKFSISEEFDDLAKPIKPLKTDTIWDSLMDFVGKLKAGKVGVDYFLTVKKKDEEPALQKDQDDIVLIMQDAPDMTDLQATDELDELRISGKKDHKDDLAKLKFEAEEAIVALRKIAEEKIKNNVAFKESVIALADVLGQDSAKTEIEDAQLKHIKAVADRTSKYIDDVIAIPKVNLHQISALTQTYYDDCTRLTKKEQMINNVANIGLIVMTCVTATVLGAAAGFLLGAGALPLVFLLGMMGLFLGGITAVYASDKLFGKKNEIGFFAQPYQKQVEAIAEVNDPTPTTDVYSYSASLIPYTYVPYGI